MTPLEEVCGVFLPKDTLRYFDMTSVETTDDEVHITLTEKNNPPEQASGATPIPQGFKSIMVSDFPIRGKRGVLTYRRRYWKVLGEEAFIVSAIPLVYPGTKIETAFAEILKKRGGDDPDFLGEYRDFLPHAPQGV